MPRQAVKMSYILWHLHIVRAGAVVAERRRIFRNKKGRAFCAAVNTAYILFGERAAAYHLAVCAEKGGVVCKANLFGCLALFHAVGYQRVGKQDLF